MSLTICPFPCMLSQDMTVKGLSPAARRCCSAAVRKPYTLFGWLSVGAAMSAATFGCAVSSCPVESER